MSRSQWNTAQAQSRISTSKELMAAARALRLGAAGHYRELAATMRRNRNEPTARTFERLADEEDERSRSPDIAIDGDIGEARREKLENWAQTVLGEGRGVDDAQLATPYTALAVAVRDAERIFSAFSYLAALAEKPEVKLTAEGLAEEELGRGALLRVQRRRAYREARQEETGSFWPSPTAVRSLGDLLAAASTVERATAQRHHPAAEKNRVLSRFCEETRALADRLDNEAGAVGGPGPRMANSLRDIPATSRPSSQDVTDALREALAEAERAFAFYDAVVSSTDDEKIMQRAQDLTKGALQRVKYLYEELAANVPDRG